MHKQYVNSRHNRNNNGTYSQHAKSMYEQVYNKATVRQSLDRGLL